ncbi:MAG: hypothetical protein ACOCYW_04840 [Roseicyclus sp.]
MTDAQSACERVAELYARKKSEGLVDVKFFVGGTYDTTTEAVCHEVLRLEDAISAGNYEELVFNDRH